MDVSGQRNFPGRFTTGKEPTFSVKRKISSPDRDSNPGHSNSQPSHYTNTVTYTLTWAQQIYDRSSTSRWYGDRSKSNAQKT